MCFFFVIWQYHWALCSLFIYIRLENNKESWLPQWLLLLCIWPFRMWCFSLYLFHPLGNCFKTLWDRKSYAILLCYRHVQCLLWGAKCCEQTFFFLLTLKLWKLQLMERKKICENYNQMERHLNKSNIFSPRTINNRW